MRIKELFENEMLHSIKNVKSLLPSIVQRTQHVFNEWDENEDEYAGGGICHIIAEEIADLLARNGIDVGIVSASVGEQHVWTVFKVSEGVFLMDIPPSVYEFGAGYQWTKRKNVVFDINDIIIDKLSNDPNDFEQYTDY